MANTAAIWKKRVASWRASGKTAKAFSAGRSWSAGTLLWWSSRLGRDAGTSAAQVRFAQVVRSYVPEQEPAPGAIVVEWLDARLRLTIQPGANRETLAAVLTLLAVRADR